MKEVTVKTQKQLVIMTHQTYQERLEEILDWLAEMHSNKPKGWDDSRVSELAVKSITQLCEDVVKAVIGEEETYDDLVLEDNKMHQAIWQGRHTRNKQRQAQHQTANLILKGE